MITNIQVLRAFAALSIVYYHTDFRINSVHTSFQAVEIFFVLSGFIMTYVSRKNSKNFLARRLIRIVPLYWIFTILFLIYTNLGLSNPVYVVPLFSQWLIKSPINIIVWIQQHHGLDKPSVLINLAKSLLFIPYVDHAGNTHPILGVGWTLNLEVIFYIIFALSLKFSKRYAPFLAIVIIGLTKLSVEKSNCFSPVCLFYSSKIILYFVAGIICFYIWNAVSEKAIVKFKGLLIFFSVIAVIGFFLVNLLSINQSSLVMLFPPSIVLIAVFLHKLKVQCNWIPILILGDASYILYLNHVVVIETFRSLGTQFPLFTLTNPLSVALIIITSSLISIVCHRKIELPLIRFLRRAFAI